MSRMLRKIHSSWRSIGAGIVLTLILASPVRAQNEAAEPLARYVPAQDLAILLEHNGLDAQPGAWEGTAAYKMLNETSLGAMLEDILAQLLDRALRSAPGIPVNGKETLALLSHLAHKGIVIAYCGTLGPPQPQPKAVVVVIRGAAKNEVFRRVVSGLPPLNEPAAKKLEQPGGRTVWVIGRSPLRWWYEKEDAVFSFAPPGTNDPVIDVLTGKAPSALKNPAYVALAKTEAGRVPVGRFFLDKAAIPPLPPQAAAWGLDGIQRLEARWEIQGKGIVTTLAIQAPRPRRGALAFFDQPPIGNKTTVTVPKSEIGHTLLSLDPVKLGNTIATVIKENDPDSLPRIAQIGEQFRAKTGLSLRDDLLGKIGPRMALIAPPGGGIMGNAFGMWFKPPEFGLVAEVKDPQKFGATLDRLIDVANGELKSAGALVPPVPGQPSKPGTTYAEFRRLKPPEQGYVLVVPPAALPTPAGLKPTILFDAERGVITFASSPKTARLASKALVLDAPEAVPDRDPGAIFLADSDPSSTLPELLTNLPALVQFVGFAVAQPGALPPNGRAPRPPGPPFRLALDPETIPDAEQLRQYLFPSKVTLAVDDDAIRIVTNQAFPLPVPQLNSGMETQAVLIALLLPAVQSAREAARRAQCVNNLKQIGLAMHTYHSEANKFPTGIVDENGKPLLSWRVAILPYIDQKPLYDKFKLDEPWDSPHNKALLEEMPKVYACPSAPPNGELGSTTYRSFAGPQTLLEPGKEVTIADITDGTAFTLMVVESAESVPWTKPEELPFDVAPNFLPGPLYGAGSKHPGGFNALFGDGSVRFLKSSIDIDVLRALITRAGGEAIPPDAY